MRSTTTQLRIYRPGKSDVGTNLPYESASPGTWTSVYVNAFAGYPGPNSGGTTNLVTGYPDTAWCNCPSREPAQRDRSSDGIRRRLEMPPQRPPLRGLYRIQRRIDPVDHARDRGRVQLSERQERRDWLRIRRAIRQASTAFSMFRPRSTAIRITTRSPRFSSARARMPSALGLRLARIAGTRPRSSTFVTAPTRPRRSILRRSRGSTSFRPAFS